MKEQLSMGSFPLISDVEWQLPSTSQFLSLRVWERTAEISDVRTGLNLPTVYLCMGLGCRLNSEEPWVCLCPLEIALHWESFVELTSLSQS